METKLSNQKAVIQTLVKEEVKFKTPKKTLLALVRQYGSVVYGSVSTGRDWDDLRHHLLYKVDTGINLRSRRTRATFTSVITPEE